MYGSGQLVANTEIAVNERGRDLSCLIRIEFLARFSLVRVVGRSPNRKVLSSVIHPANFEAVGWKS